MDSDVINYGADMPASVSSEPDSVLLHTFRWLKLSLGYNKLTSHDQTHDQVHDNMHVCCKMIATIELGITSSSLPYRRETLNYRLSTISVRRYALEKAKRLPMPLEQHEAAAERLTLQIRLEKSVTPLLPRA